MENKQDSEDKGLALFLVKNEYDDTTITKIEYVPKKYIDHINLAEPVLKIRNTLIILTIVEIFSALLGFSYYFIRRVKLI